MNKRIIIKGMAGVLLAGSLVSCSDDYLQLSPVTSVDTSTVHNSTVGAQQALLGACASMDFVYSNYSTAFLFFTGEASLMTYYGEVPSPDFFSMQYALLGSDFMNWEYMNRDQYIPTYGGWGYCYNLINQANQILEGIDTASGTEKDRAFIKAQALTIRAHAYVQLMKIYGPRWEDSRNGEKYALVQRLTPGVGDAPLVTVNTTMNQIYADLDEAIRLYTASGKERSRLWEPNIDIARGVYARAAMLKNDYATARKMAHDARQKYPIMTAEQYMSGFVYANDEYMWSNQADDHVDNGYWNWGTIQACNGAYISFWGSGSGMLNYILMRKMADDDIRLNLFLTPRADLSDTPLTEASFYNPSIVDQTTMDVSGNTSMKLLTSRMALKVKESIPNSDDENFANAYEKSGEEDAAANIQIPFGAHFKFWGDGVYSWSQFPYMRAAEMLLIEAECAYMLHDEGACRDCLTELNSQRHTETYDISGLSGNALWEEYMLSSRLELWGEGHTWFNMKRWRVDAVREAWEAGNVNSNNIPAIYRSNHTPDSENGWRWTMPYQESNTNKEANRQLLNM